MNEPNLYKDTDWHGRLLQTELDFPRLFILDVTGGPGQAKESISHT
jgi:hypothetical protein